MIAYHGTNELAAKSILKNGFNPGTYFAIHKSDALKFGGRTIFSVRFKDNRELWPNGFPDHSIDGWQFHLRHKLNRNKIVGVEKIATGMVSINIVDCGVVI